MQAKKSKLFDVIVEQCYVYSSHLFEGDEAE